MLRGGWTLPRSERRDRREAESPPAYAKTREALAAYFDAPSNATAELVRLAFWLEAPTRVRGQQQNRTVDEIWAIVRGERP